MTSCCRRDSQHSYLSLDDHFIYPPIRRVALWDALAKRRISLHSVFCFLGVFFHLRPMSRSVSFFSLPDTLSGAESWHWLIDWLYWHNSVGTIKSTEFIIQTFFLSWAHSADKKLFHGNNTQFVAVKVKCYWPTLFINIGLSLAVNMYI